MCMSSCLQKKEAKGANTSAHTSFGVQMSAHMSFGAHGSANTSLEAHTSAHMISHTSLVAHTSPHTSMGAHTSAHMCARMCAFLPRAHTLSMCFVVLVSWCPCDIVLKISYVSAYKKKCENCYVLVKQSTFLFIWRYPKILAHCAPPNPIRGPESGNHGDRGHGQTGISLTNLDKNSI